MTALLTVTLVTVHDMPRSGWVSIWGLSRRMPVSSRLESEAARGCAPAFKLAGSESDTQWQPAGTGAMVAP